MVLIENLTVVKRSEGREQFDLEKVHRVLEWATEGITGVSISQIEIKANIQLYDTISTAEIHDLLIKSTVELITSETPNYQYVAARLVNFLIRKQVYNSHQPDDLYTIVCRNIEKEVYDHDILNYYTEEQFNILQEYIDHQRDYNFTYAGIEQHRQKYLVQDRVTNQLFETPQVAYMMIAAILYKDQPLAKVKEFYDLISNHYISLPTPLIAGVRTPIKQYSSCVLVDTADSIDGINATAATITKYISKRAGIGINAGRIRAVGSRIHGKTGVHTGIIPFLQFFQAATKSCNQGSIRAGAATIYYPIWHYEFEDLVVLKNNKGIAENRVRHVDHAFQLSKLFYQRLIEGEDITFFSPDEVPGLLEAFYVDQQLFEQLYTDFEKDQTIRKKTLPAIDVFSTLLLERKETGRIYIQNIDHANDHGSYIAKLAPITQSNLCCEIDLPTIPQKYPNDPDGRIALCTLSAINWGLINDPKDFEKPCTAIVRALDNLLDYQQYPILAAEKHTKEFRPLGIGITNLAFFLAKRGLVYDQTDDPKLHQESLKTVNRYAEYWSYYMIKASADLAAEKGACLSSDLSKYAKGILPIDTYKDQVDQLVPAGLELKDEWEELREQLIKTGIRNTTLIAAMPAESSSLVLNSTNGIEPPRGLVSYKQSKNGLIPQVVPQIHSLKNKYNLLWDQKSPAGYLQICAILQKYMDQGISVNTFYNSANYPDNKIPMSIILKDFVDFYKFGGKQLYYFLTNDDSGEEKDQEEDDCGDVCKL